MDTFPVLFPGVVLSASDTGWYTAASGTVSAVPLFLLSSAGGRGEALLELLTESGNVSEDGGREGGR